MFTEMEGSLTTTTTPTLEDTRKQIHQHAKNVSNDFDTIDEILDNPVFEGSALITVTANLYDRIQANLAEINKLTPLAF